MRRSNAGNGRISLPVVLAYVAPCLSLSALSLPLVVYLPTFYANQVGLPLAIIGSVFMLVRVFDIMMDPVLGSLMDRTRTKFGRFRMWMLIGAPLTLTGAILLFFPPADATGVYLFCALLVAYFGYSINILAHTAWGSTLTSSYHERAKVYGFWQSANITGLIMVLAVPVIAAAIGFTNPGDRVRAMGAFSICLMPFTIGLMTLLTPESAPMTTGAHRSWVNTFKALAGLLKHNLVQRVLAADLVLGLAPGITGALFLFFFGTVKGYSAAVSSLLLLCYFIGGISGAPGWMWLSRRLGKHRALIIACIYYAVTQLGVVFLPRLPVMGAALVLFTAGLAYAASTFLLRALMADVVDDVTLSTGKVETPLLFALLSSTNKLGYALAVGITFNGLALIGFKAAEGAHNSASAISGLSMLYGLVPPALAVLGALCFVGYNLTEARHTEIRAEIDRLHIGDKGDEDSGIMTPAGH